MYIIKVDYKLRISTDLLNRIIVEGSGNGDDVLQLADKVAVDTITSYAGALYDILPEFTKLGDARNALVKTWALNIATYEVYNRIDDEDLPGKVIKNYDDTIEDLQKVAGGKMSLNLPPKPSEGTAGGDETASTTGGGLRRLGSNKKRTHLP